MGHTVTQYSFHGKMFSMLCFFFVVVHLFVCFYIGGECVRAQGGSEGMGR